MQLVGNRSSILATPSRVSASDLSLPPINGCAKGTLGILLNTRRFRNHLVLLSLLALSCH